MTSTDSAVILPGTFRFDLAPRAGGPAYRVFCRTPPGEPPEAGWPVLYMLDGNAVFATAVDAVRVQAAYPLGTGVREGVVVAVGYPTDAAYDSVRRSWDYGPPPGKAYPPHTTDGPDVRTGGADLFLAFLEDELKPEIERRTRIDRNRQSLFGHSFGGLFALHALFRRPMAFSSWIAVSPSIYWEDFGLLASAEAFERRPQPARVLIAAGGYEQTLAPFQIGAPDEDKRRAGHARSRTVDNAREMAERLDAIECVDCRFEMISGETHMSLLPAAINIAIRFALGQETFESFEKTSQSS